VADGACFAGDVGAAAGAGACFGGSTERENQELLSAESGRPPSDASSANAPIRKKILRRL
jgi:hypothetical protein